MLDKKRQRAKIAPKNKAMEPILRLFQLLRPSGSMLLVLLASIVLGSGTASASHFRGASLTWKRLPSPANTVEVTVTETWRDTFVGRNTYNLGDNNSFSTAGAPVIATAGGFSVIRRVVSHTYPSEGPFTISASSCCRIGGIANASNARWNLQSVVDLRSGNLGSPVVSSPVILQMVRGGLNSIPLAFVDVDGDPVTFRMATSAESGIPSVPSAGSHTLSVSGNGVLNWDTSATSVGQLYAAQVIATDNHPLSPSGTGGSSVYFDFMIQIVDGTLNQPPVANGNSGPFIASIGQSFSNVITASDPDGDNLTVTHQGLPPGASITPPSGTTAGEPLVVTFNWTPTLAQADSSFAITLIFTDPGGLQTSKSFAISVPRNQAPIANAGIDGSVFDTDLNGVATIVSLNASSSYDPEGAPISYSWTQTSGTTVVLSGALTATPSFTAPPLLGSAAPLDLLFEVEVSDGNSSGVDDVLIVVTNQNQAPTAVASAPANAPEALPVALDGSLSSDPDLDTLCYTWTQITGTSVILDVNTSNNPISLFTHIINAPHSVAGELLEFKLNVTDGIESDESEIVSIFVENVNQPPVSNAGHTHPPVFDDIDESHLHGFGYDPDGDDVTFLWTQIAGPPAPIEDPTEMEAHFEVPLVDPVQGCVTLTFQLEVSDAIDGSDLDALTAISTIDVLVKHANRAPFALAGSDQTAPEGNLVTLNGEDSYDPENDTIVSYLWTQTAGTSATLDVSDPVHPSFIAPDVSVAGEILTFSLVVNDGSLDSEASTVNIEVIYVNNTPVLQSIPELIKNEGTVVTMEAVASDPDLNPLTYSWEQLSGSIVSLDLTDPIRPFFTAPSVECAGETLTFELEVSDGFDDGTVSATVTVLVRNVNNAPISDAGINQIVAENTAAALDGVYSSDPDGEVLEYSWSQFAGPTVALTNATTQQASFTSPIVTAAGDPDASVTLTFKLTVSDGCGGTSYDYIDVVVSNVPHDPVADAGGGQMKNEAEQVTLSGAGSLDPDGDPLTYAWQQIDGPTVALNSANTVAPTFTAPFTGAAGETLVFELTVDDGWGGEATDTVMIAVLNINTPPAVNDAIASSATLWPPNHKMVSIAIAGVKDPDGNEVIVITSVTQDEPTEGLGDGDTGIDAIIQGDRVLIRSERSGKEDGRVYHIHFTASDLEGQESGVVTVSVPHSKKKGREAVDGGELFPSTE